MKRAMLLLLAIAMVAGVTGCVKQWGRRPWACMGGSCAQAPENCQACNGAGENGDAADPESCRRGCRSCKFFHRNAQGEDAASQGASQGASQAGAAGPATGAVTYPYYTTRGPRDFLAKNPPSIGP